MSAKDAEIRRRVLSKLENELAEGCQRIVSVRKDSKNIEESGVAYVRKVKHKSQSYAPVKERKYMITQNFNSGWLGITKKKQKKTPSACYRCGKVHWAKDCPYRTKKCQNCDKFGHKGSQCRNRKIIKNRVRHTKSEDESDKVVRKYITVKLLNKSVRFQLDSGSDLSIINLQTWRKLNRPIIKMTSKTARKVTGDKIKLEGEIIIPVSLNSITKKIKVSYCSDNTDIDLLLRQRNLSVLITARRVHYGEMGKAPTTPTNLPIALIWFLFLSPNILLQKVTIKICK